MYLSKNCYFYREETQTDKDALFSVLLQLCIYSTGNLCDSWNNEWIHFYHDHGSDSVRRNLLVAKTYQFNGKKDIDSVRRQLYVFFDHEITKAALL